MADVSPWQAAVDYHVNTELYDRSVCTGPMGKDGILPATNRERGLIESNAQKERYKAAQRAGLPLEDMDRVIRDNRVIDEAIRIVRENRWQAPNGLVLKIEADDNAPAAQLEGSDGK